MPGAGGGRGFPAQQHAFGVVRQPVFRADQCILGDGIGALDGWEKAAMKTRADVPSGVRFAGQMASDFAQKSASFAARFSFASRCIRGRFRARRCACLHELHRADILPRTRQADGMAGVRRSACCALRRAAGASMPRAVRPRKDAGQDKRTRHCVALKSSLHVGWARHAPSDGTVPRVSSDPHRHWPRCVLSTLRLDGVRRGACHG